jgi:cytidylate kinase
LLNREPKIIAFDGTSASGKGTIAKLIAQSFSIDYLDTGKIFRKIGYVALLRGSKISLENLVLEFDAFNFNTVKENELLTDSVSSISSLLAQKALVRTFVAMKQKEFVKGKKIVVVDGRDIGTVIFPDAELKFFFDADINIRAERRFKQLQKKGRGIILRNVLSSLKLRDSRDRERAIAPLIMSKDSIKIDTTLLSIKKIFEQVENKINEKLNIK